MSTQKNENPKMGNEKKEDVLNAAQQKIKNTDPQEKMEGPVSSLMQNIKEVAEDEITKEEADKIKNENM